MKHVLDCEVYGNFFLCMMMNLDTKAIRHWEMYEGHPLDVSGLRAALAEGEVITFNGLNYDMPILALAMAPHTNNQDIKDASDRIILKDLKRWAFYKQYEIDPLDVDHIDIMEPTPGVQVSLKSYAGRIHAPKMQDLPIEPNAEITAEQRHLLRKYCANDLDVTSRLYRQIEGRIELRRVMSAEYGVDLRSKSDAQIAEAVIQHEVQKLTGREVKRPTIAPGTTYKYRSPRFINFETAQLQTVHAQVKSARYVVAENGSIDLPEDLANLKITIGISTYQMGIGGLHSTEKTVVHREDENYVLQDADVNSFYPTIIIRCGLFPKHLGKAFIDVYRKIVVERLRAKHRVKELKAEIEAIEKELSNGQ